MQKYSNTVTKRSGVAIEGASVAVTTYPAGAAAAIYSDDGITSIPGSIVTTDANGHFEFYAADGRYTLSVSGPGLTPYTLHDVLLLEDPTDDKAAITALQESVAENAADIAARLPEIGTYALLRAYTGPLTAYYVRGGASLFDGGAGVFRVDASDTTSADNGGTILVGSDGRRWKREFEGAIRAAWFGALGAGSDDTNPIRAAVIVAGAGAAEAARRLVLPNGTCKVSGEIPVPAQQIWIESEGVTRIQPTTLTPETAFTIFNFAGLERGGVRSITFYMYGAATVAIGGKMWRQAKVDECYFIGGYGAKLDGGTDVWGTSFYKCRFNDCIVALDVDVNGQTFNAQDCLFYNSSEADVVVTNGSQVLFKGCVFENAGGARARAVIATDVDELAFENCQSERLYVDELASGSKSDYDMQFTRCRISVVNSRFWGGGYGSAAPGNSRQYGIYLDASTLTIQNSRIYSFREHAIYGANGARVFCDLQSRVDYKVGGDLLIDSSADVGENLVCDGAFERFRTSGSGTIPFSWLLPSGGAPTRLTAGLMGAKSVAALQINDGNSHDTNAFPVDPGTRIAIRFLLKISVGPGVRCLVKDADSGATIYTVLGGDINISGSAGKSGLISDTCTIPAGTRRIYLRFSRVSGAAIAQIEEVAVYKIAAATKVGSVYSDNDGTYGFVGSFGPLLPYKQANTRVHTAAPLVDSWALDDRVSQRTPTVGQPKAWVCTASGAPGTWVSEGNL